MDLEPDACRVFSRSGALTAEGFVLEHDGARMLVEIERLHGGGLDPGSPAQVEVLSPVRGAVVHDGVVVVNEMARMELADVQVREVVQQRSAVRVPTDIPVRVTHAVVDGEQEELEEPLDLVVQDVSAHGMRLRGDVALDPGRRLVVPFDATGTLLELVVEVLRAAPTGELFAHGCQFVGLGERETDALFRFVLDEQRRQLAERSGRL